LANIFKKIKTIDTIGDAPRTTNPSAASHQEPTRLGLKPVLKAGADDLIDATDFQDPFGTESENDLAIPEIRIQPNPDIAEKAIEEKLNQETTDNRLNKTAQEDAPHLEDDIAQPPSESQMLDEQEAYNNIRPENSETHKEVADDSPNEKPKFLVKSIDLPKAPLIEKTSSTSNT